MRRFSTHVSYLREALLRVGVGAWLRRPGRVLAALVLCVAVSGLASLFGAFHLATHYGALGSIAASVWMVGGIAMFSIFIEPWLAPTGFRFRALHAHKATPGQEMAYLARLDAWVRQAGVPCRVEIMKGYCPWALAYGIERCLAPARLAAHAGTRLDLAVRTAPPAPSARPRRL